MKCDFEQRSAPNEHGEIVYQCARCLRVVVSDRAAIRAACGPRASGVGDTLARALARLPLRKKKDCGCAKRQRTLNSLIPYSAATWQTRLRRALRLFVDLPRWLASWLRSLVTGRN